jgi:hypothetical protein
MPLIDECLHVCPCAELHVKDGVSSEHFVQANFHIEVRVCPLGA